MTWYYQKFPTDLVAAEKFETRGINTIIFRYQYRVDPDLGKGVCEILWNVCACPSCVAQLDKDCLPDIPPSSKPRNDHVGNCYFNKILEHYNDCIIMKLLYNKTNKLIFTTFVYLLLQECQLIRQNLIK